MTAQRLLLWKIICIALAAAAFAAGALVSWWVEAWNFSASGVIGQLDALSELLFFWGGLTALGVFVFSFGILNLKRARASAGWPTVQGRVLTRDVKEMTIRGRWSSRTAYMPTLTYEYVVSGHTYRSNVIQFGLTNVKTREEAEQILGSNTPGKPVQVHYDPENPQVAVLQHGNRRALRMIGTGVFLFALPFALAWLKYFFDSP
jgi:hypothetical protein